MTEPDYKRIALHLNNLATILQQLAVELNSSYRPTETVGAPLNPEELRRYLGGQPLEPSRDRYGVHPLATVAASEAEPECGCSLYSRCGVHETSKTKPCTCNGPDYRSTGCPVADHREAAKRRPDRDPALIE